MNLSTSNFKYLGSIILGFIFAILSWIFLARAELGVRYEPQRWTAEVLAIKLKAAEKKPSPRILIAGGSGVNFGLSAKIFEQETKIPSVNLGTHAGLMLDHLLYTVGKTIRRGDVVLLALEYPYYEKVENLDPNLTEYVFAYDPGYIDSRSFSDRMRLYFSLHLTRLGVGVVGLFTPPMQFVQHYESNTLDPETGDDLKNAKDKMTDADRSKAFSQFPVGFFKEPFHPSSEVWEKLKNFNQFCAANGVTVYAAFPPTIYYPGMDEKMIQHNSDQLVAGLKSVGIPTLGRPEDFRYEADFFYDTAWHMNDIGREKHTQYIIRLFQEARTRRTLSNN